MSPKRIIIATLSGVLSAERMWCSRRNRQRTVCIASPMIATGGFTEAGSMTVAGLGATVALAKTAS